MRSPYLPGFRPTVLQVICSVLAVLSIAGCDTGGGYGVLITPENAGQGKFLDSAVDGLGYDSLSWNGITETNGAFFYQDGEDVTFSVGNVIVGTCRAQDTVTPLDLVCGADTASDPTVTNISRFLQSLDLDGNPDNGILITGEIREILQEFSLDFTNPDFENSPDVALIFDKLNEMAVYGEEERGLVPAGEAQIHLEETLAVIEKEALAAEEALQNIEFGASIVSPSGHGILIRGQGFVMEGSVAGGTKPYTFLWNFGDGERFSRVEDPGFVSFSTPGTYTVAFVVEDAEHKTVSDSRYITVWDPAAVDPSIYGYPPGLDVPAIVVIEKPQDTSITVSESLHLPARITRGNPPFRYYWGFDSTVQYSWDTDPLDARFTFTAPGKHTVTISCRDSSGDQWNDAVVIEVSGLPD